MKTKFPKQIEQDVKTIVEMCKKVLKENLVSVILFGSAAKGRFTKYSDLDFCVIVNDKYLINKDWKNINKIQSKIQTLALNTKYPFDIIIKPEKWLKEYDYILSPLILEITENSVTVHGKNYSDFLNKNLNNLKMKHLLSRLKREGYYGWQFEAQT